METQTSVGVGVMVLKDGKVLLQVRRGSHGAGEYAFPGGHLEYLEAYEECAARETKEECGLEIKNIRFLFCSNFRAYAPKHYAHIGIVADWASGEPQLLEPEKSDGWAWYDLGNLPGPIFQACRMAFDAYRTGRKYYVEGEDV